MMLKRLRGEERAIGAVEFALIAPVLISFVIGITQLGKLFFANADMKNALAAGARVASIWPVPDDNTILNTVDARLVRSDALSSTTPSIVHGTDANGNAYIEIGMTYTVPLDFIFFEIPSMTLRDSRRVFTQVSNANSTQYTSTSGSSGATTSSTTGGTTSSTTGGTTSTTTGGTTSSTTGGTTSSTTGGTTSTSSTSASSTGGTSSTSASSTSASSTSASSTTSSSGNASSTTSTTSTSTSSGNNGSSGHAHGNCRRC